MIGDERARANCTMLLDIPERLAAHATEAHAHADDEPKRLINLQEQVLDTPGVGVAQQTVANAQARLDVAEEQIEAAQAQRRAVLQERAEVASGDDPKTKAAFDAVQAALKRQDLQALRQQAARTPTQRDDTLVDYIGDLNEEIESAASELNEQKVLQAQHRKRLAELERMRHDYRRRGIGRDSFDMANAGVRAVLLG